MANVRKYRHFGVMLDCSRNAVMKVSQVKLMIDCLQKMGYNTLQLYTEDTYEIKAEPYFGYLRGRYTGAEIKEIDKYARDRGIELIPCIQTLAHFTALVKNRNYSEIVDVNDILLVGEEKTYELIDKIFKTLAENFTSRLVNIGMDEAHMVGLGKYLDKNGYGDRYKIILNHLKKVLEIANKYGFKAHMWSDMFFRLATKGKYYVDEPITFAKSVLDNIPEDVELAYWDYYGKEKKRYDLMFECHEKMGRKTWFAGGAWTWSGFAPRCQYTMDTMKPAMESVIEHNVQDVLITMWGDNGRECSPFSLLHMLYTIRQYADGNFDQAKIEKGFYELFKLKYSDFMLLEYPNLLVYEPRAYAPSGKGLLYNDVFMGVYDNFIAQSKAIPFAKTADSLKKAAKSAGKFGYIFESTYRLCDVLAIKTEIGIRLRRAYQSGDKKLLAAIVKDLAALGKRIEAFHEAFYELWMTDNKPQGWEIQDARLGGLICRVHTCQMRLKQYLSGKLTHLEELEEELMPYQGDGNYGDIISRSIM